MKIQAERLEQSMVTGRRWKVKDFELLLMKHPLMFNLVRLMVWGGFLAPIGTPQEVVDILSKAVNELNAEPDIVDRQMKIGWTPFSATPAQLTAQMAEAEPAMTVTVPTVMAEPFSSRSLPWPSIQSQGPLAVNPGAPGRRVPDAGPRRGRCGLRRPCPGIPGGRSPP